MDSIKKADVLPYFSLVYGSRATRALAASDLKQLMQRAQAKNQRSRITGFLHHHEGKFFQFLEGNRQRVLELMETITADPRHQVLRVVHLGQTGARRFPTWSMRWVESERAIGLETVVEQVVVDGANALDDDTLRPILLSLCERLSANFANGASEQ